MPPAGSSLIKTHEKAGWGSPVTQTRVIQTPVSRHFLSINTCDIGYFDICFQTFNAQWQLNPDTCFPDTCFHKESRHLFPDTCFQKESRHLFPDTCFRQETRHLFPDTCFQQESRHLFPDTCFLELYPDTCFLTPVSPQKKQTPVSRHLFPPQKIRLLFPDSCFPYFLFKKNVGLKYDKACLTTLYNGKDIFCLKYIACSKVDLRFGLFCCLAFLHVFRAVIPICTDRYLHPR